MTDIIVSVAIADVGAIPQPSAFMATNGTRNAYLSHSTADWSGVAYTIVGEWDRVTGAPLVPVGGEYAEWVRPFGNESGTATGPLDSMRWQGAPEKKLYAYDDTDPDNIIEQEYPDDQQPFSLKIERQLITDDGFPHIPHGWKVTMISADPARDITARAIGIYSDPECTQYLYTSGAFLDDGSGVYFSECPVGQRTGDEEPIYFSLLLGSAQEGIWNMGVGTQEDTRNFWERDQGAADYSDTGQVTTGMAGTVTLIQDNSIFNVGDEVRIDGVEMTVTSKWNTTGLVLSPYVASPTGSIVEKK